MEFGIQINSRNKSLLFPVLKHRRVIKFQRNRNCTVSELPVKGIWNTESEKLKIEISEHRKVSGSPRTVMLMMTGKAAISLLIRYQCWPQLQGISVTLLHIRASANRLPARATVRKKRISLPDEILSPENVELYTIWYSNVWLQIIATTFTSFPAIPSNSNRPIP